MNLICTICNKDFKGRIDSRRKTINKCCSMDCRNIYLKTYTKEGLKKVSEEGKLLCYSCKEYKELDNFYNRSEYDFTKSRSGKNTICITCSNKSNKKLREANKYNLKYILSRRLVGAKSSCSKRKIEFDTTLTINDLLDIYDKQKGLCAITNKELKLTKTKELQTISLDRINSSKGYTKNNLQLVCWVVNQMKNNLSLDILKEWCLLIVNNN